MQDDETHSVEGSPFVSTLLLFDKYFVITSVDQDCSHVTQYFQYPWEGKAYTDNVMHITVYYHVITNTVPYSTTDI